MSRAVPNPIVSGRARTTGSRLKRIAFFTGNYHLVPDGVSLTLNRLAGFLEDRGVEVLVFGPEAEGRIESHVGRYVGVRSIAAPGRNEYRISLGFPLEARRQLRTFRPDLVHIATPDLLGRAALSFVLRHGIPVVSSYHTNFPSYLRHYGLGAFEALLWSYLRRFYKRCEHVYAPSETMSAVLKSQGVQRVHLWRRGVDVDRFHPGHRSLRWRREIGVEDGEALVLFVGRTVREKGLAVLADVARRLAEQRVPHRVVVVGDGPDRARLERDAPTALFLGFLQGDALARAYASADLFLFPSETETLGNVTLEAMASGLPAVCADAPGSRDLVEDGRTGFLVEAGNSELFTERVAALVSEVPLRVAMGSDARARALEYEWHSTMSTLSDMYEEVLAARTAKGTRPAGSA